MTFELPVLFRLSKDKNSLGQLGGCEGNVLKRSEAEDILATTKRGDPPLKWEQKASHANALAVAFGLTDKEGSKIPGLTVHIEWQPPKRHRPQTLLFSVFLLEFGNHERVYQLEICPAGHSSHREGSVMRYGAHQHVGDWTEMLPAYCSLSFADALAAFCERANLTLDGTVPAPDEFGLTP